MSEDKALLDWAENHPEAAMAAVQRVWAICGPGYREIFFNWRLAFEEARDAARNVQ